MPAGDRKIARYLRDLTLARTYKRLLVQAEYAVQSTQRGLTGGEIARATKLIEQGQLPELVVKVRWVKLNAGKAQ